MTVTTIKTVDVGDSVRNYCMAFYGYHGSKCTEDKDATQKYLSTDRKWEIHLQVQSHFYAILSQCKRLAKIRYTLNTHYQKEKENFCLKLSG